MSTAQPEQWGERGETAASLTLFVILAAPVALYYGWRLLGHDTQRAKGIIEETVVYAAVWAVAIWVIFL